MSERTIYKAGKWWVEVSASAKGCVVIRVTEGGMSWMWHDYGRSSPSKEGWPRPRWWQRSVQSAVRWGIALADRLQRRDQEAAWALEQTSEIVDDLSAQAEALAIRRATRSEPAPPSAPTEAGDE